MDSDDEYDQDFQYNNNIIARHQTIINNNTRRSTKRDEYYILICLDLDMTLIDARGRPFESVKWFAKKLKTIHPKIYTVINTMASESHVDYTISQTGIEYNHVCADADYGKPICVLRKCIRDIKYLNGPSVMIDDKSFNLRGQYDVEINVSKYFIRNSKHRVIDVNYKAVIEDLETKLENYWKSKNL